MSFQYLTNSNPPPSSSLLEYDVEPGTTYLSSANQQFYANLTITVSNTTSAPVNCMEFQFGILAGAGSGNLTTATEAASISPVSDQDEWSVVASGFSDQSNPNLFLFSATPSGISNYLALDPNASLVFHLNGILIDQSVGEGLAPFTIIETTGTSRPTEQKVQGTLPVDKVTGSLAINSFDVDPPTAISPGTPIELSWALADSDHWQLYDTATATLLYDSNTSTPPNLSQWPVSPQQLTPETTTTYELIAWAGAVYTAAQSTAMVAAPQVTAEGPTDPVDALSDVVIRWQTANAQSVKIEPTGQTADATSNQGSFTVQPSADTEYALTATWTDTNVSPSLVINSQPANIEVFVNPPAITSFTASPQTCAPSEQVNLAWQTQSAVTASLAQLTVGNPSLVPLGDVPLISSSYPVEPVGVSTYLLTAASEGTATSQATAAAGEDMTPPAGGSGLLYDDVNKVIWVLQPLAGNFVGRISPSDGSPVGQSIAVDFGPFGIVFDGTSIWVACAIANSVTRIRASDGTVQGGYLPVGSFPLAIAYDWVNKLIWTVNNQGGTVSRLNQSDGSSAGPDIKVGTQPISLTFDGTNVWVVNTAEATISLIKASDGTIGNPIPSQKALQLTFDGTNVWAACYDGTVKKFDSAGNAIGVSQTGCTDPSAILWDGTYIWVADVGTNTVSVLQGADGTVVGVFPATADVQSLAFDGNYLWVFSNNSTNGTNALSRYWAQHQAPADPHSEA